MVWFVVDADIGTHLFVECMQLFDKWTNPYILF